MRHLIAIMIFVVFLTTVYAVAQEEQIPLVDKIHLQNGSILEGKVTVIKTDVIEFTEQKTGLVYEIEKSEIKIILLSSGQSITFGLVILASIGAVLVILLLVGAAAS